MATGIVASAHDAPMEGASPPRSSIGIPPSSTLSGGTPPSSIRVRAGLSRGVVMQ